MELLESRELRDGLEDLLPEDMKAWLEMCDETDQPMVMIWRKVA